MKFQTNLFILLTTCLVFSHADALYIYRFINDTDEKLEIQAPFRSIPWATSLNDAICPKPVSFAIEPGQTKDLTSPSYVCTLSLSRVTANGKKVRMPQYKDFGEQFTAGASRTVHSFLYNAQGEVWHLKHSGSVRHEYEVDVEGLYFGNIEHPEESAIEQGLRKVGNHILNYVYAAGAGFIGGMATPPSVIGLSLGAFFFGVDGKIKEAKDKGDHEAVRSYENLEFAILVSSVPLTLAGIYFFSYSSGIGGAAGLLVIQACFDLKELYDYAKARLNDDTLTPEEADRITHEINKNTATLKSNFKNA